MQDLGHNSERTAPAERVIVLTEANSSLPLKGDFERMARRRHQSPKPFREGNYWWIKPWTNVFVGGELRRKQKRIKLAPSSMKEREVLKIADEHLRRPSIRALSPSVRPPISQLT